MRNLSILNKAALLFVAAAVVSACSHSSSSSSSPAPATGNPIFEPNKPPIEHQPPAVQAVDDSKTYYVYPSQLNVRSTPATGDDSNVVGRLAMNDQVHIIGEVPNSDLVEVVIVKTNETIAPAQLYFVSRQYLGDEPNQAAQNPENRYFMIENIATEKLRVYEKGCDDGNCPHKLILEADVAAGEKTSDRERMTILGYFHITDWIKFYQDAARLYPSWYDPSLPMPPPPGASVLDWTKKSLFPTDDQGASVRGAFGWYAAIVGPNPHDQWTHGTIGWGADKKKYILITRGFWANLFTDPRSHGCTRTDNETISYLRHLLPVGTPMLKVYAIEDMTDPSLAVKPQKTLQWSYIMTKRGVRQSMGEENDQDYVLAQNLSPDQYIEKGTYTAVISPSVKTFREGSSGATASTNGNIYGLMANDMHGKFLVDEGRLIGYADPDSLVVGGYGRGQFPSFVIKSPSTR